MRYLLRLLPLLVILLPVATAGASSNAGFASQSVFLSSSAIVEGQSVTVYANIANNSNLLFSGTVIFSDNAAELNRIPLSLPSGEASVVSTLWQPASGVHTVTAKLEDSSGMVIGNQSAGLTVAQIPSMSTTTSDSSVQSSTPIVQAIAGFSAPAASSTAPLFGSIDTMRSSATQLLTDQINKTEPKLPGNIPGIASTSTPATASLGGWIWSVVWTIYFYVLTVLRYIVVNLAFFYAALILCILYLLHWLYRRMSPKYHY